MKLHEHPSFIKLLDQINNSSDYKYGAEELMNTLVGDPKHANEKNTIQVKDPIIINLCE